MNKELLFTIWSLLFITSLKAQIEQVSVGQDYAFQTYYNLSTGEAIQVANDSWDIAFTNQGLQDAGVILNESNGLNQEPLKVYLSESVDWLEPIVDTTVFVDSLLLFNLEENWREGAFNIERPPGNPFDYGWGQYNRNTFTVEGDKIFVIKKRDGSFMKFQIMALEVENYIFRYAELDGSNEVLDTVAKDNTSGPLIHYSFEQQEIVSLPQDYDLIFQRYFTPLDAGDGTILEYSVTGVLLGPGTKAVVVDSVNPLSFTLEGVDKPFSDIPKTIGHDWKVFDFEVGWLIDEDRVQFVETKSGEIYKLIFYDFEGSATGTITLEKTQSALLSTKPVSLSSLDMEIFPNPSEDYFRIKGIKQPGRLHLVDNQGRIVLNRIINPSEPIDISHLATGIYRAVLSIDNYRAVQTIVVSSR